MRLSVDEVYRRYADRLFSAAFSVCRNPSDAEDAVQDACLKAYKSIRSLKKPEAFKHWFMQILANCCKDLQAVSARLTLVSDEDPALANAPYYASFSDGYVERYLDRLDETDRQIVLLSVLGGYTGNEIGKYLNMKPASVRSRLSRALHALRNEMEADQ